MTAVRVAIAGAGGRMGRALLEVATSTPGVALAAALEAPGSPFAGKDAGELCAAAKGVAVATDVAAALANADVLVDFTRPEGTMAHLAACQKAGRKIVIGTTGFSDAQRNAIAAAAKDIAIVMAPNMAVGVNVVFKLAEIAARALGDDYDVEIVEAHHRHKVDAPSGTAIRIGEIVAAALGRDFAGNAVHGRHGVTGERDAKAIGFHALRGGDIVGEHTVMFAGAGERVEVTVRSSSRSTYAAGAMRAARFLADKPRGLFDMQAVLGLA